jgi:hypothetical protein
LEEIIVNKSNPNERAEPCQWRRIPDGVRVRHRYEQYEGCIDGLTELCLGKHLNPDGKTQYRIDVGSPERQLVSEDHLNIVADRDGLIMMNKQPLEYRRDVTNRLRAAFTADRFVTSIGAKVENEGGSKVIRSLHRL